MQERSGSDGRQNCLTWEDICVSCGAPVPEGRMICWKCEHQFDIDEMAAFRPQREEKSEAAKLGPQDSRKGKCISLKGWLARRRILHQKNSLT